MAIPKKPDLIGMDYSFQGQPFVNVPARSDIDTAGMDYSFQGQPFVTNPDNVIVGGWTTKSLKAYIGGTWVSKPLKVYIGGIWVTKDLKTYL